MKNKWIIEFFSPDLIESQVEITAGSPVMEERVLLAMVRRKLAKVIRDTQSVEINYVDSSTNYLEFFHVLGRGDVRSIAKAFLA